MNLCDDGHDEVCYEVKRCPVCEMMREVDQLNRIIDRLNKEIDKLSEDSI